VEAQEAQRRTNVIWTMCGVFAILFLLVGAFSPLFPILFPLGFVLFLVGTLGPRIVKRRRENSGRDNQ